MIRYLIMRLYNWWQAYKAELAVEFYSNIADLINDERVLKLDEFTQHFTYTRLRHSLDVAFVSFLITKHFGWDSRSAARGGLLHDLFFYDWRDEEFVKTGKNHATEHPKIALANARQLTTLNKVEEDIIVKHMWLITITPPKYKEGFVVSFVDKYCAAKEAMSGLFSKRRAPRSLFKSVATA